MSTRSSVGVISAGGGYIGRYVHYDGYPVSLLAQLRDTVVRDGVDAVVKRVVEDHCGWSSLYAGQPDPAGVEPSENGWSAYCLSPDATPEQVAAARRADMAHDFTHDLHEQFVNVPGYGVAYTAVDSDSDDWVTAESDDDERRCLEFTGDRWDSSWLYAFAEGDHALHVYRIDGAGAALVAVVDDVAMITDDQIRTIEDAVD